MTDKEKAVARNAITKSGIVRNDGQTFINKNDMANLLNTDKKGAEDKESLKKLAVENGWNVTVKCVPVLQ